MKTYTVKLTGQQKHIPNQVYEDRTPSQVQQIIDDEHDTEYTDEFETDYIWNGESHEINSSYYIEIFETDYMFTHTK